MQIQTNPIAPMQDGGSPKSSDTPMGDKKDHKTTGFDAIFENETSGEPAAVDEKQPLLVIEELAGELLEAEGTASISPDKNAKAFELSGAIETLPKRDNSQQDQVSDKSALPARDTPVSVPQTGPFLGTGDEVVAKPEAMGDLANLKQIAGLRDVQSSVKAVDAPALPTPTALNAADTRALPAAPQNVALDAKPLVAPIAKSDLAMAAPPLAPPNNPAAGNGVAPLLEPLNTGPTSNPIPFERLSIPKPAAEIAIPVSQDGKQQSVHTATPASPQMPELKTARDPVLSPPVVPPTPATTQPTAAIMATPAPTFALDIAKQEFESLAKLEASLSVRGSELSQLPAKQDLALQIRPETLRPDLNLPRISNALEAIMTRGQSGAFEIKMQPAELGMVRMVLSHSEAGMTAVVSADRPEILDLMRRNADSLLADLKGGEQGSINLKFENRSGDQNDRSDQDDFKFGETSEISLQSPELVSGGTGSGLDIRL